MAWYERHPDRLALERRLLGQYCPQAKLVKQGGVLRIWLKLRGGRAEYLCELIYPQRFPFEQIEVHVRSPSLDSCPHLFNDGCLCLCEPEDVGSETTAVVYIEWLKVWIERYEDNMITSRWRD